MIDTGLLLSGALAAVAMWLATRRFLPDRQASGVVEDLLLAALWGVIGGRAVAAFLDDPESLRSLRAFLVIRGGVELWPGAAVAAVVLAVQAGRRRERPLASIAALAPVALVGYAAYEATCLVREGCYGPVAPVGLRPDGLTTTMIPGGVVMAMAVAAAAGASMRLRPPAIRLLACLVAVAGARSVLSIWLPRLAEGLTRPHRTSIAIAVIASGGLGALGALALAQRRRHPRAPA